MTKEFLNPNVERRMEIRHDLVIMVSSFVIRALVAMIRLYQLTISPAQIFLFGPSGGCRFTPSCSQYAVEAIKTRGAIAGTFLAANRICRCHPFGKCGHDPVPKAESGASARPPLRKAETEFALGNSI
jgi:hypothetical protein